MAWPASRYKTFSNGGSFTPADANAIQDQYVRATGILADDLDKDTVAVPLGLTQTAASAGGDAKRRGTSIIATEETLVTPAAYTNATTPDRVQNIVLPSDGFIIVGFQAMIKGTAASGPFGALFIGANQAKVSPPAGTNPVVSEAQLGANATFWQVLASGNSGMTASNYGADYGGDVTTGQLIGVTHHAATMGFGLMHVFAAAGTYDVGIKYKAGSGNVTVKNRKLWVWTVGF